MFLGREVAWKLARTQILKSSAVQRKAEELVGGVLLINKKGTTGTILSRHFVFQYFASAPAQYSDAYDFSLEDSSYGSASSGEVSYPYGLSQCEGIRNPFYYYSRQNPLGRHQFCPSNSYRPPLPPRPPSRPPSRPAPRPASRSASSRREKVKASEDWKVAESVYDFTVNDISGNPVSLSKYKGHVLLIVNVASRCGLTATNYRELVELHERFHDSKGLRILAFPCNQFGGQEPGTNEDIVCFAKGKNAHFDFFDKVKVNGEDASPLWKYLKKEQGGTLGDLIKWNFTKFIVDKNGKVVERHGPTTDPLKLVSSLEKYF